ncbi:transposase [Bifidobacterium longum]|uniref:transposase n=1 Tax=Bifidobacterium longum TaxID=216816 RepID=UPI001F607C7E|nr:transposase [Bifidobacterium longum]
MNSIFNQLLNVKGVVVETVRIVDSPLRPEPVLEVRVRPRRGMLRCSPLWQTSSWLRPRWRRASLASSGFRLLRVELVAMMPRVDCPGCGVVVASVPWAEPGSRFTRDFESECAWLMSDQAKTELNHWVFWASHNRIPEIVELARRIRRRRPDILRTIQLGYSNARLEASDNRIKVTIRMAYGFHHVTNLIALVMLRCGGLDVRLPQPAI